MGYNYDFSTPTFGGFDLLVAVLPTLILLFLFVVVIYFVNAIGLYKMAKNRGYKNAWIAFIPVVNSFVMGSIADNINACAQKRSNFRYSLLALSIGNTILGATISSITVSKIADFVSMAMYGFYDENQFVSMLFRLLGFFAVEILVAVAYSVVNYIVLYKIFADYSNNNAVLFMVLSILFGIGPFFILGLCNKQSRSIYYSRVGANNGTYQQQYNNQYNNQQYNNQYSNQQYNNQYNNQQNQQYGQYSQPMQPMQPIQQPMQPIQQPIQPMQQPTDLTGNAEDNSNNNQQNQL